MNFLWFCGRQDVVQSNVIVYDPSIGNLQGGMAKFKREGFAPNVIINGGWLHIW